MEEEFIRAYNRALIPQGPWFPLESQRVYAEPHAVQPELFERQESPYAAFVDNVCEYEVDEADVGELDAHAESANGAARVGDDDVVDEVED